MYSDLMKCTVKMYYLDIYIFMYTVCFNLMSDMKFMYSLNKIPVYVNTEFGLQNRHGHSDYKSV